MNWNKSAKECVYAAVFVAVLIASQLVLSFIAGVEIVTVLFIAYAFAFGLKRGIVAGFVFSLLRQLVFGFFPIVLILYLLYYPLLAVCFGLLGKKKRKFWSVVLIACICTTCFTLLDDCITPLWLGYSQRATKIYFYASLPVMARQVLCTAVTVALLFSRLKKVFIKLREKLQ